MIQKNAVGTRSASIRIALANFLQRNRSTLIFSIIAIFVVLAVAAGWAIYSQGVRQDYGARIEKLETDFGSWKAESDPTKKAQAAKSLEQELGYIQSRAPNSYALLKAYFVQGEYFAEQKKWSPASQAFHMVFEKDKRNYLAPVALVNAAVCLENGADLDGAAKQYQEFLTAFPDNKILTPQVYFSLGRIAETQNRGSDAEADYKKMIEQFPESDWTKLARDRSLSLVK